MREKVFSGRSLKCLNLHYGARFYDPAVGRWWVTDPADEYHTPYAYVGNKVTIAIDPDGEDTWVIHGTNSNYNEAFGRDGHEKWAQTMNDKMAPEFNWDGGPNTDKGRRLAANNLALEIAKHKQENGGPINIVAHSHGGNVAIMAANILKDNGIEVDNLILVATPNRKFDGQYQLKDGAVKGKFINISNKGDLIQPNGGGSSWGPIGEMGPAEIFRYEKGALNYLIDVDAETFDHSYQNKNETHATAKQGLNQ